MKFFGTSSAFVMIFFSYVSAEVKFNAESNHKLLQSYGLFFDPKISLIFRGDSREVAEFGGSGSILESDSWGYKAQLIIHASATSNYHYLDDQSTIHVETTDARVGLAWDVFLDDSSRLAFIWTHQSGHVSDNIEDPGLIGPDLGNEIFDFRYVYDIGRKIRMGAGFRPAVVSTPRMRFLGAHEFFEWYPDEVPTDPHKFTPFVALGLEQYGLDRIALHGHLQIGYVAGAHLGNISPQSTRIVIGYYNGADTRMKYFQFRNTRNEFGYFGLILEL